MSEILEITTLLRDSHALIKALEQKLAHAPDDVGLQLNISSVLKRQKLLEKEYSAATNLNMLDVCGYRLIAERGDAYPIAAIGNALTRFQEMVTVVFDAIKNGPKTRARIDALIAEQAMLDFSYVKSGSLEFRLTVPNERLLTQEDSDLDKAINKVFEALSISTPADLRELSKTIGIAGIKKIYHWINCHASYEMSSDITWRRGETIRKESLTQVPRFRALKELIEHTEDVTEEVIKVTGLLVGYDSAFGTFHMSFPDANDIKGKLDDNFNRAKIYNIPKSYSAGLLKRVRVLYSTDYEDISYNLQSLGDI